MNYETLLRILHLALRTAEVVLGRRAERRETPPTPTRADKVVARVAPLAERVLDRMSPESAPAAARAARPRRKRRSFVLARAAVFGAIAAGATAYVVTRQQRRVRERYRLVGAHLPQELLEVLSAPGGEGRLEMTDAGGGLRDPATGTLYPVVDGVPDFVATPEQGEAVGSGLQGPDDGDWLRWMELIDPLKPRLFGISHMGNAALAGAVGAAAQGGWALSVPCGMGAYEIEIARTHPQTRLICMDTRWNMLLETRRKAREAGVSNLYFVRGNPTLLPLPDASMTAVWTANALHHYAAPERLLTQIVRVAKPGALVGGVSLVAGGPRFREALVELAERHLPGRRDAVTHFTLLHAAGLQDVRAFRDGGYIRFSATKA
jgi:hypothetical protein